MFGPCKKWDKIKSFVRPLNIILDVKYFVCNLESLHFVVQPSVSRSSPLVDPNTYSGTTKTTGCVGDDTWSLLDSGSCFQSTGEPVDDRYTGFVRRIETTHTKEEMIPVLLQRRLTECPNKLPDLGK